MLVGAIHSEEIGQGTKSAERSDSDEKLHFDLRSQIERSKGARCEKNARR